MRKTLLIILVALGSNSLLAQNSIPKELFELGELLKQMPNVSYDFKVVRYYDSKNVDSVSGKYTNFKDQSIESCSRSLAIQDKKWFYKVDHKEKYVVVSKNSLFRSEESMSKPISYFSDSVLYKFGSAKVTTENGVIKATLSFSKETTLRSVYMEFDKRKNVPLVYTIVTDIPDGVDFRTSEPRYIRQVFTARKFVSGKALTKADLSDYFVLNGNDVKLKKYTNYKLYKLL